MAATVKVFFNRSQLWTLHRNFSHLSANKVYQLIKKARPDQETPETLKIQEDFLANATYVGESTMRLRGFGYHGESKMFGSMTA